jgi:hypothetical protein
VPEAGIVQASAAFNNDANRNEGQLSCQISSANCAEYLARELWRVLLRGLFVVLVSFISHPEYRIVSRIFVFRTLVLGFRRAKTGRTCLLGSPDFFRGSLHLTKVHLGFRT